LRKIGQEIQEKSSQFIQHHAALLSNRASGYCEENKDQKEKGEEVAELALLDSGYEWFSMHHAHMQQREEKQLA